MKNLLLTIIAVLMPFGVSAQRHVESLNFGWEFRLNDEGAWKKVDVPHDFQIEQPWVAPAADEKADNTDVAANIIYVSIATKTASQKPLPYQEYSPILSDTLPHKTEVQDNSEHIHRPTPTTQHPSKDTITHRPIPQSSLAENDNNTDMQIKPKTSAWNIQLAYNGQLGKHDNFHEATSVNAKSFSAISNILIPAETSYSNWNDYSFYLNNEVPPMDMTEETRSLMEIAASNAQINGGNMEAHYEHQLPLSIQLTLSRQLGRQFSVETGLSYTLLQSTSTTGSSAAYIQEQQRLHYLGIPLRMGWQWYNKAPLSFYTSSGVMLEMPIHSTLNVNHVVNDMNTYSKRDKLSVPLQWSTSVGVGIQYDITPHIGFYLEPSLQYFFNDGSDIKTYRTEHRFSVTLPLGIRFH